MKTCKSCQTEIHEKASKCPHCQSFQKWWYAFLPVLPILLCTLPFIFIPQFLFNFRGELDFEELEGKVSIKKISEEVIKSERENGAPKLKILLELKNHTDENLEQPNFEVTINDYEGNLLHVEDRISYKTKLPANGTANHAIFINHFLAGENFSTDIKLTEIKEDR